MSQSSDFLPPDELTLQEAGDALGELLPARERGVGETDRTYYDTFDGLVYDAGLSAVHEGGRLALVDRVTGEERAAIAIPQPTEPLLARRLEDGPLRTALIQLVDVRALLPLVHVHSRVRALDVLDDERKTVVRMTVEEPAVISPGNRQTPLRPRLRLALVRGYDDELAAVRRRLEHDLAYQPADQPIVDEAVRAAGGVPGGTPAKVQVPLSPQQRADAAAVAVLRRLLDVIEANLDGTIADIDAEFLHDFRVSVRRSRAVQRELKTVFPADELARFRGEFRWLQQVTGDSRDLDVYVLEFDALRAFAPEAMRADLEPLLRVLEGRRLTARREMVRALRSDRTKQLLDEWGAFLEELVARPTHDRPDAVRSIAEVSGERIHKVYRRMLKMGRAIDRGSPPEDYHELRKKGKELRYLLELFGAPLYPGDVVKPMIKTLKSLQDVLGRHQDREVQVATLQGLRDEVAARPGGPAALMAMGVLVQVLGEDEQAARDQFAASFTVFASSSQRGLVQDTFG
jgi:CHAD domain-containing protein